MKQYELETRILQIIETVKECDYGEADWNTLQDFLDVKFKTELKGLQSLDDCAHMS